MTLGHFGRICNLLDHPLENSLDCFLDYSLLGELRATK
jgi:hypothetical protein